MGKIVNHFDGTNGKSMAIFASGIHDREGLFIHTHHGTLSATPFFVDNSTFVVYFLWIKSEVIGPIMQNKETRVNDTVTNYGYIRYIIYRFVHAGVCVQVLTETNTDAFQPIDDAFSWEMGCTIETHMFKEVCQSSLVVFFKDRTYFLCNIEIGTIFG